MVDDKNDYNLVNNDNSDDDDYEEIIQDYDIIEEIENIKDIDDDLSKQSEVMAETEKSIKKTIGDDIATSLDPDVDGVDSGKSFSEKIKRKARVIGQKLHKVGMIQSSRDNKDRSSLKENEINKDKMPDSIKKDVAYDSHVDKLEGQQPGERGGKGGWER